MAIWLLDARFEGSVPGAPKKSKYASMTGGVANGASDWSVQKIDGLGYAQRYGIIDAGIDLPSAPYSTFVNGASYVRSLQFTKGPWGYGGAWQGTGFQAAAFPLLLGVMKMDGATTSLSGFALVSQSGLFADNWGMGMEYIHGPSSRASWLLAKPMVGYIWRPSTQAIVGTLWNAFGLYQSVGSGDAFDMMPGAGIGLYSGGGGSAINTPWQRPLYCNWFAYRTAGFAYQIDPTNVYTVNGIQADDQLIIEWWGIAIAQGIAAFGATVVHPTTTTKGTLFWGGSNFTGYSGGTETAPNDNAMIRFSATGGAEIPSNPIAKPNLISVSPQAASGKLRLGFDNPVGISGPTIGAPAAGLVAQGASLIDDTTVDLDVRPDSPSSVVGF